jgi:hypothetical protein
LKHWRPGTCLLMFDGHASLDCCRGSDTHMRWVIWTAWPLKMGTIGSPETSVLNHLPPSINPEDGIFHWHSLSAASQDISYNLSIKFCPSSKLLRRRLGKGLRSW